MATDNRDRDMEKKRRYMRAYNATPHQKKVRAMRNTARRKAIASGKAKVGDGMDVHHIKPVSKGGTNADGVKVITRAKNRGHKLAVRRGKD
jgi:hypothetical protein